MINKFDRNCAILPLDDFATYRMQHSTNVSNGMSCSSAPSRALTAQGVISEYQIGGGLDWNEQTRVLETDRRDLTFS